MNPATQAACWSPAPSALHGPSAADRQTLASADSTDADSTDENRDGSFARHQNTSSCRASSEGTRDGQSASDASAQGSASDDGPSPMQYGEVNEEPCQELREAQPRLAKLAYRHFRPPKVLHTFSNRCNVDARLAAPRAVAPCAGQMLAFQALQEVIRGGSMTQKDKLRRLQEMCARPEGWLLQKCLEGNGWNPVRGCLEGFPCWSEAVHRLTVSLNALASQRMPPPLVDESEMVYVAPTGPDCFAGTSCLDVSAVWLREILSPPATRSIVKLDLSASNHVKLGGATVSSILEPLVTGMRVGELDLSGSPLQDVGAQAIAKLLSDPRCSLEKLNLSSCLFWTVGCMAILGAAHKCDSLQALGLANNDVGTPGALMVARLLRQGLRLLSLDLGNARVSGQGMQAIAEALPDNVSLLALNLRDNDAGFAGEPWRHVIETHRYLQKLTLPRPVTTTMVSALEEAHSGRQKAVLPPVNWQLATFMSMHPRLGARSLLRHLPCHLLECIVGLSCSAFELELSPPPTLEADGQDQAAA